MHLVDVFPLSIQPYGMRETRCERLPPLGAAFAAARSMPDRYRRHMLMQRVYDSAAVHKLSRG